MKKTRHTSIRKLLRILPVLVAMITGAVLFISLSRHPAPTPEASVAAPPAVQTGMPPLMSGAPAAAPMKQPVVSEPLEALVQFRLNPDGGLDLSARPHPQEEGLRRVTLVAESLPKLSTLKEGSRWSLPLPGRPPLPVQVNYSRADEAKPTLWTLGGEVGQHEGSIYLAEESEPAAISGCVLLWNQRLAWRFTQMETGALALEEIPASELVCVGPDGLPTAPTTAAALPTPPAGVGSGGIVALSPGGTGVPACSSRPTATSVLYLDFEGGSLTSAFWNAGRTVTYAAAGLTNAQMLTLWSHLSEDYRPFNVNVTTDRTKYTAASAGRRMRIVLTTTQWSTLRTGFAAIGSFPAAGGYWANRDSVKTNSGFDSNTPENPPSNGLAPYPVGFVNSAMAFPTDIVCWGFTVGFYDTGYTETASTQNFGRMIAHELGHTFGLMHDSRAATVSPPLAYANYYPGHGTSPNDWSAMMGGNYSSLAQWSKGEYANAVNNGFTTLQDDIAIIGSGVSGGGSGLLDDDGKGDTIATAAVLNVVGGAVSDGGTIYTGTDVDCFRITVVTPTPLKLTIAPTAADGNLDAYAELQNASGTVLASANDGASRNAVIDVTSSLAAGSYYLFVRGTAVGTGATGWTRYGNLGQYSISGSVLGANNSPQINAANPPPNASVGVAYNFPLLATNSPTSYYTVGGTMPPGLSFNAGAISGTPTTAGFYDVTVAVSNAQGGNSKLFNFVVYSAAGLPEALDAQFLPWTTSGSANWSGQQLDSFFGGAAGRSGAIGANSESVLETLLPGPGTLTFYWRTSSHASDRLAFRLDNTDQFDIGGETTYAQRTVSIGNGSHYARWIYRTDPGTIFGQNAGFVDKVVYTQVPQFPNGNVYVSGVLGKAMAWQVNATNGPTGFAVTSGALPPGVTVDSKGLVSGVPTSLGTFSPEITATNPGGTSVTYPTFYIYPDISLATALDTTGLTWVTGIDNPWLGDTTPTRDGTDAAHSGPIRHNLSTFTQTSVTGPGTVSFFWKASTEANADVVTFSVDGTVGATASGEQDWVQRAVNIGPGAHILRWEFARDNGGNGGSNMVWLDQVVVTPASATLPLITSSLTSTATTGVPYTYQMQATNSPTSFGAQSLPPGLEINGTTGVISGVPLSAGGAAIVLFVSNSYGWNIQQLNLTITDQPLAAGPDAGLNWNTSGSGGNVWFNQTTDTHDGIDALRSGPVTHSQNSFLQATVYGPGLVTFWWKTDSESGSDVLDFKIDGILQSSISGLRGWAQRSTTVSGAGTHFLSWTYQKDGSVSTGLDSGWVDEVVWTPAPQLPVMTSTTSIAATVGSNILFQATATNSPTSYALASGSLPGGLTFAATGLFSGVLNRPGSFALQVNASNVAGTSLAASLTITVKSSLETWAAAAGLVGSNALFSADPDKDGRTNLLEMALNQSPTTREANFAPVTVNPTTKRLTATFTRIAAYTDLMYEVQVTDNLSSWTTIARSQDGGITQSFGAFSVTDAGGSSPTVIVVDNAAPPTKTKRTMRIKITQM